MCLRSEEGRKKRIRAWERGVKGAFNAFIELKFMMRGFFCAIRRLVDGVGRDTVSINNNFPNLVIRKLAEH